MVDGIDLENLSSITTSEGSNPSLSVLYITPGFNRYALKKLSDILNAGLSLEIVPSVPAPPLESHTLLLWFPSGMHRKSCIFSTREAYLTTCGSPCSLLRTTISPLAERISLPPVYSMTLRSSSPCLALRFTPILRRRVLGADASSLHSLLCTAGALHCTAKDGTVLHVERWCG